MPFGGLLTVGGILGASTLAGSALSAHGAGKQAAAAKEAELAKIKASQEQAAQAAAMGEQASNTINQYGNVGSDALNAYGAQGIGEMMAGRDMALGQLLGYGDMARNDLLGGYGGALGAMDQGMMGARGDVMGGLDAARSAMDPVTGMAGYAHQAAQGINPYDVAGQFAEQSQMGRLMADPSGYMAQDPGYQFRQQQGNKAINEQASARGGRLSGRTLEELSSFNQGLASQEFGAAAQRAQAADAQTLGALMNQGGRADQAGLATQGIQAGLGQMGMGAHQGLAGMAYGAGNTLGQMGMQGGMTNAGIHQAMGGALAGQAGTQGSNLANLFSQSGNNMANAYFGLGNNMANHMMGMGTAQANAQLGGMSQANALASQGINSMGSSVPFQGGQYGAWGNGLQQLGQLGAMAMMMGAGSGGSTPGMAANGQAAAGTMGANGQWNMLGGL